MTSRPLAALWLLVVLPFPVLAVVFISGLLPTNVVLSHATFHILYLPIAALAVVAALALARSTGSASIRVLAGLVAVLNVAAFAGHAGELVVVLRHGAFHAPESVFDLPAHVAFANVTPTVLAAAIVLVLVMTVITAVQRRQAAEPAAAG